MDDGAEDIEDDAELMAVRRQARRVHLGALAFGIVATTLAIVIAAI